MLIGGQRRKKELALEKPHVVNLKSDALADRVDSSGRVLSLETLMNQRQ